MANLSKEEQDKLVFASQNGDIDSFSKLTQELIPYVRYVIKKVFVGYEEHGVDTSDLSYDDILQAGFLGLIGAVNGYKPDKGAAFSSYAYHGIEGAVKRQLSFELNRSGIKDFTRAITTISVDDEDNGLAETLVYDEINALDEIVNSEELQVEREKFKIAIASLTEEEKKILFMINGIDFEPTSNHKKIAKELGMSEIAVKKAISSATKKMTNALGE